jgi:hypothetical protein
MLAPKLHCRGVLVTKHLRGKVLIAHKVLGLSTPKLVQIMWPGASSDDSEHWRERIYSWRKSHTISNPRYVPAFFQELHRLLKPNISAQELSESTMLDFFSSIDPSIRKEISFDALVEELGLNESLKTDFPAVHVDWQAIHERLHHDLSRSFANQRIDQKFLYMSYDSIRIWKELIRDEYKTYTHCMEALKLFLQSSLWLKNIDRGTFDCIVDLGVGAGDKDIAILDSILGAARNFQVRFVLVDTSSFMIDASLQHLEPKVHSFAHRLTITPLRKDFLDLTGARPLLHNQRRTAFFILGNTFSNIAEVRFMRSTQQVSRKGDLLVIGTEFLDSKNPNKHLNETKDEFLASNSLRELAITPIRFVRPAADFKRLSASVDAKISEPGEHSDLHKARAITIYVDFDKKPIAVAYSNRYDRDEFEKFVCSYQFEFKGEFPSVSNPHYRHMVFEKLGK